MWITNTLLLIPPYKIQTYWHICITINSDISLRVIMYIHTCWWYKCWWGCMHVYSIWTHYILRKKRNHRICDDDNNNGTKWVMLCFLLVHAFMPFLCLRSLLILPNKRAPSPLIWKQCLWWWGQLCHQTSLCCHQNFSSSISLLRKVVAVSNERNALFCISRKIWKKKNKTTLT